MFPVTRPLRQTWPTILLLVLTVLPTAFVAAIAWRINRPGHIRDVEIELGRKLGMQVSLDGRALSRARRSRLPGTVLRQEEPRGKGLAEIARADTVRLNRADRELTLLLENPRLHAESPAPGLALLDVDHPALDSAPIRADRSVGPLLPARPGPGRSAIHVQGRGGRVSGRSSARRSSWRTTFLAAEKDRGASWF